MVHFSCFWNVIEKLSKTTFQFIFLKFFFLKKMTRKMALFVEKNDNQAHHHVFGIFFLTTLKTWSIRQNQFINALLLYVKYGYLVVGHNKIINRTSKIFVLKDFCVEMYHIESSAISQTHLGFTNIQSKKHCFSSIVIWIIK